MRNDEQMIEHLRQRYTYDAAQGVVRNRKGLVIKGHVVSEGYLLLNMRLADGRHAIGLHQLVWVLCHGRFPKQIDHLNGNPTDNRIENLREVSQSENDMNRVWAWKPNAKTGLPGVCKSNGRYRIKIGGKEYKFHDKYEAFLTLTMLGRMFKDN